MEALLTTFVAAALAEWGDKTQMLVVALAALYRRPLPILAGILVAATANSLVAAFGGAFVHDLINPRAASLLVALALVFAGVAGLIRPRKNEALAVSRAGPFLVTAASFFVVEIGDKTQFLTFALSARYDALALAAAGATAGILASNIPAAAMGDGLAKAAPLKGIRLGLGAVFVLAGLTIAVSALQLV